MAGGIFVSYRKDDSRHAAGRLWDRLRQTYAPHQLFMDVDVIPPGRDFVKVISERVAACDVMLVMIGPGWLDARDGEGARRLDNPLDLVRIEVETALERDVLVIPVLVDGAPIPQVAALPEPLRPLVRRQAVRLTHERFGSDADDLVRSLRDVVQPAAQAPSDGRPGGIRDDLTRSLKDAVRPAAQTPTTGRPGGTRSGSLATRAATRGIVVGLVGLVAGYYLGIYTGTTLFRRPDPSIALLALPWFLLAWAAARRAASSKVWEFASAVFCGAAWVCLAMGLIVLSDLTAGVVPLGFFLGGYALSLYILLWKVWKTLVEGPDARTDTSAP